MESLWQDLKFGVKLLFKEKGFSLTALLTLALCVGANTAVFTVINSVLLRPLPFPASDRLVALYNRYPGVGVKKGANGVPDYLDRKQETSVFEEISLIGFSGYDLGLEGSPERVSGLYVTPSFFRMLRIPPLLGRSFAEEEAVLGKDKVVLLSYGLWKQKFGGDASALGKDVRLSGVLYKIVGVMPEGFEFLSREAKLWVPFAFTPQQTSDDARHNNSWSMVARLKPGVTVAYAQQRVDAINQRNLERFPKYRKLLENARFGTKVGDLKTELIEDVIPILYLMQAAVAFVLLIGCVNVANLMLVRSNIRMKELAIRFSLGAGRARIARQLLTESVLLAFVGGALGIVVGFWGIRLLTYLGADQLPRGNTIEMDGAVLGFTLLVAVLTGLFFGIVPIVHLFRRNLNEVFRQTERTGTAERPALVTRSVLVVCQVALAFALLIGAGLMTLSFRRVLSVEPGFKPENVLTARLGLPRSRYEDDARARNFIGRTLENARSLPGVKAVGMTTYLPFSGSNNSSVIMIENYPLGPGENPPVPGYNVVDTDYFRAMGIPLLRGRTFQESDTPESQKVVLIDQFLARKYWPKGDPIGAGIRRGVDNKSPLFTIIGVAGSVKTSDLAEQNPVGQVYYYYKQFTPRSMHLVLKSEREETPAINALRAEVLRLDAELPLFDVKTMPARLYDSLVSRRGPMMLCLILAGLAVILSAIGIYGVLAYTVAQRTREFGIRLALGAQTGDVLGMVFWQGLRLAAIGLAIGMVGSYFLTRLMTSLLFEVKPADPVVFLLVSVLLGIVALVASLIPSLRATRINPVVALRYE